MMSVYRKPLVGTFGRYLIFAGSGVLVSALTLFVPLESMLTPPFADYARIGIFVAALTGVWFLYDVCPPRIVIPLGSLCWIVGLVLVLLRTASDW